MTARAISTAVAALWFAATACKPADAARIDRAEIAKREARLAALKNRSADSTTVDSTIKDGAIARWVLPKDLDEISGVALTPDGRLLAQSDERAQISEIDFRRGIVTKQFVVGAPVIRADLEGIAVANDVIFLLGSNGILYEFREGANGERVNYTSIDTHLGKECEFEGLAYDSTLSSLLMACKNVDVKDAKDMLVIYRWRLHGGENRLSRLTVPLAAIQKSIGKKEFHPSDITVDPISGNYVLIAGIEEAMVEITPAGELVFARPLRGTHKQPESIAITRDSILIIGDEATRQSAVITLYRWP
jgi:uncharacterized protein YjiK